MLAIPPARLLALPGYRRELAAHPEIVRDQEVLEIGSGCGACGILAAKLGARQVRWQKGRDLNGLGRACVNRAIWVSVVAVMDGWMG